MEDSNPEILDEPDSSSSVPASDHLPQIYPPQTCSQAPNEENIIYASVPNSEQQVEIIADKNSELSTQVVFGRLPVDVNCAACKCTVTTRIQHTFGCFVWIMCLVFYIICPCFSCIPLCVKRWHDVIHYCPKCSAALGQFNYLLV